MLDDTVIKHKGAFTCEAGFCAVGHPSKEVILCLITLSSGTKRFWGRSHPAQNGFGEGLIRHKITKWFWERSHPAQNGFGEGLIRHKMFLGEVSSGTKSCRGGLIRHKIVFREFSSGEKKCPGCLVRGSTCQWQSKITIGILMSIYLLRCKMYYIYSYSI